MRVVVPVLALLGLVAAIVGLAGSTTTFTADNGSLRIAAANSSCDANAETSENVYQQQVVALWGIKDMTQATAEQNKTIIDAQVAMLEQQGQTHNLVRAILIVLVLMLGMLAVLGSAWLSRLAGARAPATTEALPAGPASSTESTGADS